MRRLFGAIVILAAIWQPAAAHHFTKGDLQIGHPWTRATPEGTAVGVGYLKITNNGKDTDRLTGGTFQGAASVEIHEMKMDGDKMTMRQIKDGLEIKPGETVKFEPGGYHLMFLGMTKAIAPGPHVKGSLTFEKAGSIDIEYKVEPVGATSSSDTGHGDMKMDDATKMHDH